MRFEISNAGSSFESSASEGYTIKFPSTTKDNGSPSHDLMDDCNRVFALIDDERYIAAQQLYASIQERMKANSSRYQSPSKNGLLRRRKNRKVVETENEKFKAVEDFLSGRRDELENLQVSRGGEETMLF